jgi:hypothetical protein
MSEQSQTLEPQHNHWQDELTNLILDLKEVPDSATALKVVLPTMLDKLERMAVSMERTAAAAEAQLTQGEAMSNAFGMMGHLASPPTR